MNWWLVAAVAATAAGTRGSAVLGFDTWKSIHRRAYATVEDEAAAFTTFASNDDLIRAHNNNDGPERGFMLGHNELSDLSLEEYRRTRLMAMPMPPRRAAAPATVGTPFAIAAVAPGRQAAGPDGRTDSPPSAVDWVAEGAVTEVKSQARCGGCWAFAATGALESAYALSSGVRPAVALSEEQLINCDYADHGCSGGNPETAFAYIAANGGADNPLCTGADLPYDLGDGRKARGECDLACAPAVGAAGYRAIQAGDEGALLQAVAATPVAVGIAAYQSTFQLYKSGVFDSSSCGETLDHAVLIVGYGVDGGAPYWRLKNSWGSRWGEAGYMRIARGKNMCGLASQASYPIGVFGVNHSIPPHPPVPPLPPPLPPRAPSPPSPPPPSGESAI